MPRKALHWLSVTLAQLTVELSAQASVLFCVRCS